MKAGARDPFAVDEDRWLEELVRTFGDLYHIMPSDSRWFASRRDGSRPALIADTPGELATAIHADLMAGGVR